MQYNEDYARLFRGRPLRFVLPIRRENFQPTKVVVHSVKSTVCHKINMMFTAKQPAPTAYGIHNLITLKGTNARASLLSNGDVYCQPEVICNIGCETPRINYDSYLGKKYRYFYAISSDVDAENPGAVIKVDVLTKTNVTWFEPNCYPSEPIYVSSPDEKVC